jgi:hypothetical protein
MGLDPGLDRSVVQSSLPLGELCRDAAICGVLAVLAGVTFYAELRVRRWRWRSEALLAFGSVAVLIFFLAGSPNRLRDLGVLTAIGVMGSTAWLVAAALGLLQRIRRRLAEHN